MFYALSVISLLLWFAGVLFSFTLGGYIHLFLLVAILLVLIQLIVGEREV